MTYDIKEDDGTPGIKRGTKEKYPLGKLKIGQCFDVDLSIRVRITSVVCKKNAKVGKKMFTVRTLGNTVRVTRIA